MPAIKHTMLIEQITGSETLATAQRVGGWSESWYSPTFVPQTFNRLCARRAAMLSSSARIVGQRYQQVDPAGPSSTGATVFTGNVGLAADIPQMALFCRCRSTGVRNIRPFYIRGISDPRVQFGEFVTDPVFAAAFTAFVQQLKRDTWSFRGRDFDQPRVPVFQISSSGVFTLTQDLTFAVGDLLQFNRVKNVAGRFVSFKGYVTNRVDARNGTVAGYPAGGTTGGKCGKVVPIYPVVSDVEQNRIVTRRVGRPFTGFRGRRSAKR